jgi:uncharacterized protein YbcC (UPF0753/DUF2309 family)
MPWKNLTTIIHGAVTTIISLGLLFYVMENQSLESLNDSLRSDNDRMVDQRNAVIDVNHAMHNTVIQLQNQLEESRKLDDWLKTISGTMDSKLSGAVKDIERITDGKEQTTTGCDYRFSSDVSQRMRNVYSRPGDSVQE